MFYGYFIGQSSNCLRFPSHLFTEYKFFVSLKLQCFKNFWGHKIDPNWADLEMWKRTSNIMASFTGTVNVTIFVPLINAFISILWRCLHIKKKDQRCRSQKGDINVTRKPGLNTGGAISHHLCYFKYLTDWPLSSTPWIHLPKDPFTPTNY